MSNYSGLNRNELLALCREKKLKNYSKKTKPELIKMLTPPVSSTGVELPTSPPSPQDHSINIELLLTSQSVVEELLTMIDAPMVNYTPERKKLAISAILKKAQPLLCSNQINEIKSLYTACTLDMFIMEMNKKLKHFINPPESYFI